MQDVVGCRLVVEDVIEQEEVLERLRSLPWDACRVEDRRKTPKHGYRAVHVIVEVMGKPVEIQVRSRSQDLWAQISEKMADRYGLEVKYGGGPPDARSFLNAMSEEIADTEDLLLRAEALRANPAFLDDLDIELEAVKSDVREFQVNMNRQLNSFLATLST
jgi:GTP pyrophosphokinase